MSNEMQKADESKDLSKLNVPELLRYLGVLMKRHQANTREMAKVVKALIDLKYDTSQVQYGLILYIQLVAQNQLLPEVVDRFGGELLRFISYLGISDQQKLLDSPVQPIVFGIEGGVPQAVDVPLNSMSRHQIRQLLDGRAIRGVHEQAAYWRHKQSSKKVNVSDGPAFDVKGGKLKVLTAPTEFSRAQLLLILGQM